MGINRVSLGVQSFVTTELRRTGRKHTAATVESDIGLLAAAGITNVNIDLIAGLPGQTAASWRESLDWIERLRPPHVSVYIFEIDDDSTLGREATLGGIRYGAELLPSDDLVADCYEFAVERLRELGIPRYEVSNFARAGLRIAPQSEVLAIGTVHRIRLGRALVRRRDANEQYRRSRYLPADDGGEQRRSERRHAPTPKRSTSSLGCALLAVSNLPPGNGCGLGTAIERSVEAGLMKNEGGRLRLTDRGVLISNDVLQEFVNV